MILLALVDTRLQQMRLCLNLCIDLCLCYCFHFCLRLRLDLRLNHMLLRSRLSPGWVHWQVVFGTVMCVPSAWELEPVFSSFHVLSNAVPVSLSPKCSSLMCSVCVCGGRSSCR